VFTHFTGTGSKARCDCGATSNDSLSHHLDQTPPAIAPSFRAAWAG
jgi:hypothetical protein